MGIELEWLEMFIALQVAGGIALAVVMWYARRKDDE